MLDQYRYDVPFYARLKEPVIVLADWADPALPQRDNWRKELYDAARFDPARGSKLLRPLTDLHHMACGTGTAWFVIPQREAHKLGVVPGIERVLAVSDTDLWKAAARPCP